MKNPFANIKPSKKTLTITIVSVGGLALTLFGTSAYAAQTNALPGSPLYPLKQAWESVALFVAPTPAAKAQAYLNVAQNRITSSQQVTPAPVPVIQQAQQHLQSALDEAQKVSDSTTRKEIKDSVAQKAAEVETEIKSSKESDSTNEQDVKDATDHNKQIQTDASRDD